MGVATPSSGARSNGSYDVFLSYHSADAATVRPIADYLRQQGLKPFLDRWYLSPGQPWVPALEHALARCRAVAVFIGPHGLGSWQQREKDSALNRQGREPGFPVIPVLLPGADPPLGFLGQNTWVDLRADPGDAFGLRLLICGIRRQPPGPDLVERLEATRASVCPYRGLLSFREEDAPFFFGREVVVDELVRAVARQNFLAVVGASGSGKSSVVRAGLVPALRSSRDPVWEIATLVPGDEPFKALAHALAPLLHPKLNVRKRAGQANMLAADLARGAIRLRDLVDKTLKRQPGNERLPLVVDQWEEVYTLTTDPDLRRRFVDELLDASARSPLTVVLSLCGDFVGHALAHRPLADRLQGAQVNLGPMTRAELQRVIEEPARKVGLSFEPGLVQRLLDDVGEEPGNLPLLEFALRRLWEERRGTTLSNQTYDNLGRLAGAIAQRAERFFLALAPAEQEALHRLFLQLVHVSVDGQVTRRRERLDAVPAAARPLAERLANRGRPEHGREPERLLVTACASADGGVTVEVAHEALLRSWERLWNAATGQPVGGPMQHEQAVKGAVFSPNGQRILTWSADRTVRLWRAATGKLVCKLSRLPDRVLGAAFSPDGQRILSWTRDSRVWLWEATTGRLVCEPMEHESWINWAAFSPDGRWILSWSADGTVRLWEAATGLPVGEPMKHENSVKKAKFSPDGRWILSCSDDHTVRLWEAGTGLPVGQLMKHEDSVLGADFGAGGQWILSWGRDETVRLWEAATGRPVSVPMKHKGIVLGASFSADGQRILSWSLDGTARLWSGRGGLLMAMFKHRGPVNSACFDPQEQRILTASDDGKAVLWDISFVRDISFDPGIPVEERLIEFEVRSASTLEANG